MQLNLNFYKKYLIIFHNALQKVHLLFFKVEVFDKSENLDFSIDQGNLDSAENSYLCRDSLIIGLWFMNFGLLLWTKDDSGLPSKPLTITKTLHLYFCVEQVEGVKLSHFYSLGFIIRGNKILETAQSPNSSFPFRFDFGLGLGTCQLILKPLGGEAN